jgi:hypothetical protein
MFLLVNYIDPHATALEASANFKTYLRRKKSEMGPQLARHNERWEVHEIDDIHERTKRLEKDARVQNTEARNANLSASTRKQYSVRLETFKVISSY